MEEETTALATVREPIADYRLIARNPQELEASRQSLVKFFDAKVVALDAEAADVEANLEIALKFPIKPQPLRAQLNRIAKRRLFYEKAKAAVEAGFHIVPNFDADIFAIRTSRTARGNSSETTRGRDSALQGMPDQKAQSLPVGAGQYQSPTPVGRVTSWTETKDGKQVTKHAATVTDFDGIDFPFLFARPEVLTAAQQLMADRIFDELGALPGRRRKGGDPMIVGIIRESRERNAKQLTFLVVWFLDTNTL